MRANKYGAKQTTINGIAFDSKMESEYYQQLMLMQRAKIIHELELQPNFLLLDPFTKNGKKIQGIKYRADFMYKDEQGQTIVIDVKGVRTKDFNIKKKLFDARYPDLELKLVTKKSGRWISA